MSVRRSLFSFTSVFIYDSFIFGPIHSQLTSDFFAPHAPATTFHVVKWLRGAHNLALKSVGLQQILIQNLHLELMALCQFRVESSPCHGIRGMAGIPPSLPIFCLFSRTDGRTTLQSQLSTIDGMRAFSTHFCSLRLSFYFCSHIPGGIGPSLDTSCHSLIRFPKVHVEGRKEHMGSTLAMYYIQYSTSQKWELRHKHVSGFPLFCSCCIVVCSPKPCGWKCHNGCLCDPTSWGGRSLCGYPPTLRFIELRATSLNEWRFGSWRGH